MISCMCYFSWPVVIKIGKSNFILSSDGMSQNNFTNVIKLVPILIEIREIAIKRLELRSPRDSNIESFTGKERFKIEKIVIIFIDDI